mgnify:FL=1|tara:strand:+ start:999 stop:2045 length:1047 start_codon:yes stop_codon:yes gene_type:complete
MADETTTLLGGGDSLTKSQAIDALLNVDAPEEASEDVLEPNAEMEEVEETEEIEAESEDEYEEEDAEGLSESDDEDEDDEEYDVDVSEVEEVEDEDTYYTVKVDGEEKRIKADELVKSYQLEQAAQKRLQEAAEVRKNSEAEMQALAQQREKYGQALQSIEAQLNAVNEQPQQYWDNLYQEDPLEWAKQRDAYRERKDGIVKVKAEQARVQKEQQDMLQQHHQQYLAEQHEQLLERIPEWRNSEVAAQEKQNVITYAQRIGYTEQELSTASDSRAIEALRKAYLYDELMSKKPVAQKKVTQAPKSVKSGTPKTKRQVNANRGKQALERLNKTGSKDAAVDLLLQRMRD